MKASADHFLLAVGFFLLKISICATALQAQTVFTSGPGSPISVGKNPFSVATGDFNRDGNLDLAVANTADGTARADLRPDRP
jgi:hypothetical protein